MPVLALAAEADDILLAAADDCEWAESRRVCPGFAWQPRGSPICCETFQALYSLSPRNFVDRLEELMMRLSGLWRLTIVAVGLLCVCLDRPAVAESESKTFRAGAFAIDIGVHESVEGS